MKSLSFIIITLLITFSCVNSDKTEKSITKKVAVISKKDNDFIIPKILIHKDSLNLIPNLGVWKLDSTAFNGYAVKYHENGKLSEKIGYHNGKKEGKGQFWYADGLLKKELYYKKNKIEGALRLWSPNPNSVLIKENHFVKGIQHGEQKKWHPNGQIAQIRNLEYGKEVGLQQAWLKNGKQYINYEVVNGRAFGLKKAVLCYELENEKLQN